MLRVCLVLCSEVSPGRAWGTRYSARNWTGISLMQGKPQVLHHLCRSSHGGFFSTPNGSWDMWLLWWKLVCILPLSKNMLYIQMLQQFWGIRFPSRNAADISFFTSDNMNNESVSLLFWKVALKCSTLFILYFFFGGEWFLGQWLSGVTPNFTLRMYFWQFQGTYRMLKIDWPYVNCMLGKFPTH